MIACEIWQYIKVLYAARCLVAMLCLYYTAVFAVRTERLCTQRLVIIVVVNA